MTNPASNNPANLTECRTFRKGNPQPVGDMLSAPSLTQQEEQVRRQIDALGNNVHHGGLLERCMACVKVRYEDALKADGSDFDGWNEAYRALRDIAADLSEIADMEMKLEPDSNPLGWHDHAYEQKVSDRMGAGA